MDPLQILPRVLFPCEFTHAAFAIPGFAHSSQLPLLSEDLFLDPSNQLSLLLVFLDCFLTLETQADANGGQLIRLIIAFPILFHPALFLFVPWISVL